MPLPAERDERGLGGHVKAELERFFAEVATQDEWLQQHPPRIEWLIDADCAEIAGDHPLTQTVHARVAPRQC